MARRKFFHRSIINGNQLNLPVEGEDSRSYGFVEAMHKRPMEWSPFLLANEYICSRLGEYIGLPVPPCVFTFSDIDECPVLFSELNFNPDAQGSDNLPRIDGDYLVQYLPREASGVLMFDVWIANSDRHPNNLAVDLTNEPKTLRVFDHCNALFGSLTGMSNCGIPRLDLIGYHRLGITGSTITEGTPHCLIHAINTSEYFSEWINRIFKVPDYLIEKLCRDVRNIGAIDKQQTDAAIDFLTYRKNNLETLIDSHREEFSGISEWVKPGR